MPFQDIRLVVVSNRLPTAVEGKGPEARISAGKGGLVTALAPVLRDRGGLWIGWSGAAGSVDLAEPLRRFSEETGYALHTVDMTEEEVAGFSFGFSNEVVWPLFHDFQSRCNFVPGYWRAYLAANRKFAAAQLQSGALLVNPSDVEGVADAIRRACHMDAEERRARMRRMRAGVRRYEIFWWVDSFLQTAFGLHLEDFLQVEMKYHAGR